MSQNPIQKMNKGKLIAFEGIDRSGKTFQSKRLLSYLTDKGIPAVLFQFPNRSTKTGQLIDAYLNRLIEMNTEEIHTLFSINRWQSAKDIIRHLDEGTSVIVDRYLYSGICYSAANGLPITECISSEVGLPLPDIVLLFDLDSEISSKRKSFGTERYEERKFQESVRRYFIAIYSPPIWTKIDASQSKDDVWANVKERIDRLFLTF